MLAYATDAILSSIQLATGEFGIQHRHRSLAGATPQLMSIDRKNHCQRSRGRDGGASGARRDWSQRLICDDPVSAHCVSTHLRGKAEWLLKCAYNPIPCLHDWSQSSQVGSYIILVLTDKSLYVEVYCGILTCHKSSS